MILVDRVIQESDIVIEVVDARFPDETRNPRIEKRVLDAGKALIIVLNKCDLVSRSECQEAKARIEEEGIHCALFSTRKRWGSRVLRNEIRFLARELGLDKVRVGVVGYANVGKSSLIGMLKGRASARTSPKPGFTRGIQWVRVSRMIMLLDTPGVIPREEDEFALAMKGAYDVTKIKDPELAFFKLVQRYPQVLGRLGLPEDPEEALNALARKWNMLRKGGVPDTARAARRVLLLWQKGKI